MKYVKSYLLTASVLTGMYYLGFQFSHLLSFVFDDDAYKYLVYLGLVTGFAGPLSIYLEEKRKKA